ncbi:hypothetical protein OG21DRAFT_1514861 [Imleria badia]|nr:hypothetical protein OG21DRAFT_1514861 [Imleria badia]
MIESDDDDVITTLMVSDGRPELSSALSDTSNQQSFDSDLMDTDESFCQRSDQHFAYSPSQSFRETIWLWLWEHSIKSCYVLHSA